MIFLYIVAGIMMFLFLFFLMRANKSLSEIEVKLKEDNAKLEDAIDNLTRYALKKRRELEQLKNDIEH